MRDDAKTNLIVGAFVFAGALLFSQFRNSFTSPPDDLWFQAKVVDQGNLVLVKFGADWCGPCRMVDKELDKLRGRVPSLDIVKIDVDEKPHLASHYGVSGIPRLMLFRQGKIEASRSGASPVADLENWVRPHL